MRLIVTRPREDAEALKARLEALGHEAISSPLLEIVPRPQITIPEHRYQLLAVTSANGVRALARHPSLPWLRGLPLLAVGPQSAEAARGLGFNDVEPAGGDARGLAAHIASSRDSAAGPILYISGRDSAGDFTGLLSTAGFPVIRVIAYEARMASALAPEVGAGADAVLLYSPRTARVWTELIARDGLVATAEAMIHICISANAAVALPESYVKRVATEPTDAAMLDIVAEIGAGLAAASGLA